MITVRAFGGLGNQLRVIRCAAQLARDTSRPLTIIFPSTCKLEDLISKIGGVEYEVRNVFDPSIKYLIKRGRIFSVIRVLAGGLRVRIMHAGRYYKYNYDWLTPFDISEMADDIAAGQNIWINTCMPFYKNETAGYDEFGFVSKWDDRAKEILAAHSDGVVGIHIRRTDHTEAIAKSPIELFEKVMMCDEYANTSFYVASDSKEVIDRLRDRFGDRIITAEHNLDRWTKEGQYDAMTELLCLSHTMKIYGSFDSSFSEEAARIGHIEKTVLKLEQ